MYKSKDEALVIDAYIRRCFKDSQNFPTKFKNELEFDNNSELK